MKHTVFYGDEDSSDFPIAVLIKESAFKVKELQQYYIDPLRARGITENIVVYSLTYNEKGKTPVKFAAPHIENLTKAFEARNTKTVLVADSPYFKLLTKVVKVPSAYGYVLPSVHDDTNMVVSVNYQALFYDDTLLAKLNTSLDTLAKSVNDTYTAVGQNVIKYSEYPKTLEAIRKAVAKLQQHSALSCDIEAFSLKFYEAFIGTIGFAWSDSEGISFPCKYGNSAIYEEIKDILREFFETYKGTIIYQNGNYDIKVLVYELYMDNLLDYPGTVRGVEILTKRIHDTKLIAYLAKNSTATQTYGLKALAHEYLGRYAEEDINDITKIPIEDLLPYNLKDCLGTFWVFNKYYPIMLADNQREPYESIFLPSVPLILIMELVGIPLDMNRVNEVDGLLTAIKNSALDRIHKFSLIKKFERLRQRTLMKTANKKLVKKIHPLSHFEEEAKFNPGSGPQLQTLLHEVMGLPVIDYTKTRQPATGKETLIKHIDNLKYQYNITEEELK